MTESGVLYWNYILFCSLYSIAHGAVDTVLAFSTAELGSIVGSNGSAALYICYTASAVFFAKPLLRLFGHHTSIFFGLCGMLLYVASFFLAIQNSKHSNGVFIVGGCLGGLGAGLLWPAQGAYFSTSALKYAAFSEKDASNAIALYASSFAGIYLGFEAAFKAFATIAYLILGSGSSWHSFVFGAYTIAAYCSVVAYGMLLPRISDSGSLPRKCTEEIPGHVGYRGLNRKAYSFKKVPLRRQEESGDEETNQSNKSVIAEDTFSKNLLVRYCGLSNLVALKCDLLSVIRAIGSDRLLQLMIPYQICFGFSAGFVGYYINKNVVAMNLGDGYIGLLTALSTLCAALLSYPFASFSKLFSGRGKWHVMIFGALCFFSSGFAPLVMSDFDLSRWQYIVVFFLLHGAARGCWESTNKAVIADYYPEQDARETAFATVYFTSGLSGAVGYFFYRFMSRDQMAWTNTIVPLIALVSYHYSDRMFYLNKNTENIKIIIDIDSIGGRQKRDEFKSTDCIAPAIPRSGSQPDISGKFTIESFETD